jgi:3-deoxy-D-manno-octulosonate 8-phosphate phosphatase KdsC-like HAD superfamily phosphatase
MCRATSKQVWRLSRKASLSEAVHWLRQGLLHLLERQSHIKPSACLAVFDIDGTILTRKAVPASDETQTFVFRDVQALAQLCHELGLTVVIITARSNSHFNRWYTHAQLESCGVKYKYLYMRESGSDTREMKHEARRHLLKKTQGAIVMLLGDNWPDISVEEPPIEDFENIFVGYSPDEVPFLKLPAER